MSLPILYGNQNSGHAYKVRQALVLLGVEHRYRHVDLNVPHSERQPDFLSASPYGEVPVLVTNNGVLAQSDAILLKLARETGQLDGGDLDRSTQWLFWEANRIGFSLANLRHELRFTSKPDLGVAAMLRQRTVVDLDRLNEELDARTFVLGELLSIVDIACSAYLNFASEVDVELTQWPAVLCWLDRLREVPGWEHPYDLMNIAHAEGLPRGHTAR